MKKSTQRFILALILTGIVTAIVAALIVLGFSPRENTVSEQVTALIVGYVLGGWQGVMFWYFGKKSQEGDDDE